MNISCNRRIEFDAAHRVIGHNGKCSKLHGHRYVLEATFTSQALCSLGMVVDFSCIKEILGRWIEENWDHNTILNLLDQERLGNKIEAVTHQKIYYLECNPTAENMAAYLLHDICPILFKDRSIICTKIRLYETPNCFTEALCQ